jgi:molecular chaperone DnaK
MGRVLGIDLGTFNSCVAVMDAGEPTVMGSQDGRETTPSIVAVTESGRRVVGSVAKRQTVTNAENSVYAAKRLIGRRFESAQVQRMVESVAYRIVEGPHGDPRIVLRDRVHSVPEISAMVLSELKHVAEDYLGEECDEAVVTVPAYFNDGQRRATKDAGTIAGLDVIHVLNEPTAAALAYGYGKNIDRIIAVFDLGGGTFDISILELSGAGVFKVIATSGDTFLGGEDFDQRIIDWLLVETESKTGVDLRDDRMALQRVKDASERAKCELSEATEVAVSLPFLSRDAQGEPLSIHERLSRELLEELTEDLVARTIRICEATLEEADLDLDEIEDVLLVGGMTRMPAVRRAVAEFFGREPAEGVHPDLAVARGAAVQAAALVDESHDMVLLDVTPHTLGIVVAGGWMEEIIAQNSTVPVARAKTFTTTRDEQTSVNILVVQGESRRAAENELLGQFTLSGLRSAPAGQVALEVSFELDMDGIVSVRATDLETGVDQAIRITASSGLTDEELEEMRSEAQEHAVARLEDESFDRVRSEAEALIAELEELRPRVEASVEGTDFGRRAVEDASRRVESARALIEKRDTETLEAELDRLRRALRLFRGAIAAGA